MELLDIILQDIKQVRAYTNDLLSHVNDEDWFRQPQSEINHIAWQVGHLAIVEYNLCLKRIRGPREDDSALLPLQEYARLFGKGSSPSPDPDLYPTPTEIRTALGNVHARVLDEIKSLPEEQLDESCGASHPMFNTKGGALRFCAKHEMIHAGQIALLRRLFGGNILR